MIKTAYQIKTISRRYYLFGICIVLSIGILLASCDDRPVVCVSRDTLILTPNGNVPVTDLKIGDMVFSYDLSRNIPVPAKIVSVRPGYGKCIGFDTDSGRRINVTAEHPIYSPETGGYEKASKWRSAELTAFLTLDRNRPKTAAVTTLEVSSKEIRVFDLTVDSPFNNFFADGILVHNKTPPLDITPPVNDLDVVETDSNSVTLAWTVPGNSEIYPAEYDMRFLDREWQTGDYWTAADTIIGEPTPSAPGSRDTMMVEDLQDSTTYWFGMTTISNSGGYSNLSNIVSGSTQ